MRDGCLKLMYDGIAFMSEESPDAVLDVARKVEVAAFEHFKSDTSQDYKAKMRSLFQNLKMKNNTLLRKDVFTINPGQVRAGAHSDYGSITLLFQDARGGLQVQGPTGAFVDATPIPDTCVVNAGDLLARWSNDTIKSTIHRVVEPPSGDGDVYPARYSIA